MPEYVAFVIDTFANQIVGWKASTTQGTQFVLDALEQAIHARKPAEKLIHHSDRSSQYVSIKYTELLTDAGLESSVGSVGDSYDNALAVTIIGLSKIEVINRLGPWNPKIRSNEKPFNGSIGSTRSACWNLLATSRQSKQRSSMNKP